MIRTILLTLGLIFGTAANADLSITFDEGAPKDRFDISNRGTCDLDAFEITIDLSTSQGALFFDVTKTGKGIEVYQPFELVSAKKRIQDARIPTDGDTMVVLDVARLNKGETISFTIDVDDTISQRGITVSGSEMEGSSARIAVGETLYTALFDQKSIATVSGLDCHSEQT